MSSLIAILQRAVQTVPPGPVAVAYSGGGDSTALLHALADSAVRERGLRALHVDHGLHPRSATWAGHCRAFAESLGVPIEILRVTVEPRAGTGPEDAARRARYAAFERALRPGEILALAHHRDDQAETVLLKLLRGAGPQGLGGMRFLRKAGAGWLWRPLLDTPRAALQAYLKDHALAWIDDPANANPDLRRNFLRHRIVPGLKPQWPNADAALAHSAQWLRAAADFIDDHAA
ncbi:MAG TPA: tRNA lysidine(34) synthetase TilS, partial [Rudaea sp.]